MQCFPTISLLSVTTLIRELCKHISHCCLIFPMTLGDVLLSLSADVLGMFIMQCFDIVALSLSVSGFSPGVSSEHLDELRVFLLVCGLRRVKDPLYLVELFSGIPHNSCSLPSYFIYVWSDNEKHETHNILSRPGKRGNGVSYWHIFTLLNLWVQLKSVSLHFCSSLQ